MLSDEEVVEIFNSCDADGSGAIDYSEFAVAALKRSHLVSQHNLMAAFRMFDKKGLGVITVEEIKQVLTFGGSNTVS